jgi:hypothetical protein
MCLIKFYALHPMVILIFNYLWIEDNSNADKTDLLRKDADKNGFLI